MSLASGAENTQVEGFGASHSRRVTPGEFATPKLINPGPPQRVTPGDVSLMKLKCPGPPHPARDAGGTRH